MKKKIIIAGITLVMVIGGIIIGKTVVDKESVKNVREPLNIESPVVQYHMAEWEEKGIEAYLKYVGVPDEKMEEAKEKLLNLSTGIMTVKITGNRAKEKEKDRVQMEIESYLDCIVNSKDGEEVVELLNNTSIKMSEVIHDELAHIVVCVRDSSVGKWSVAQIDIYQWMKMPVFDEE